MSVEHPAYWLLYVPESTEVGVAEVAAVAPEAMPRKLLGADGRGLLDQAQRYQETRQGARVVFLGELTRWLNERGIAWGDLDVDIFEAMRDLDEHAPHLLIDASPLTMTVVVNSAEDATIHYNDGGAESINRHVEPVRAAILEVLERDWPAWVRSVLGRAHNGRTIQ
jgi:hypothetical protein